MHLLVASLLLFVSFAQAADRVPPTVLVEKEITFTDDLDFTNLALAIDRHLVSFASREMKVSFKLGATTYKRSDLKATLIAFKDLAARTATCITTTDKATCYDNFSKELNRDYSIYRPVPLSWETGFKTNQTLFTAYYSPDFHGSKTKTAVFKNPIYAKPATSVLTNLSRTDIDFEGKLEGKGLELFYVSESLYDIWLLHVEGGGRVQVKNTDGTSSFHHLSYTGKNNQSFRMLYKYMLKEGMIKKGAASIAHQRVYLDKHPEDRRRVFATCPSYIFFKISKDEPVGVNDIPLTDNRSLASDYRKYKEYGILNFIQAKKPILATEDTDKDDLIEFKDFSRFFINQDTGGAIRGHARSDLYFGHGPEAELAANSVKQLGNQFFLIKKK